MSDLTIHRVTKSPVGLAIYDDDTMIHDCLTADEAAFLLTGLTERAGRKGRLMARLPYDASFQDRERRYRIDRLARPWLVSDDE